jgi:hypothetical protein
MALIAGRGLHSSTFQLNLGVFYGPGVSTFRLDATTFCGLRWETLEARTAQIKPRCGRYLGVLKLQ